MKKLVLFIAVIAAVSFASCKKQAPAVDATEADSTAVVEEVVADSVAADSAAVVAQ